MKLACAVAVVVLLMVIVGPARADQIQTIAGELADQTSVPLGPGVADELATNIWTAHEDTPYALEEADSLTLSIQSVLRAIMLSGELAGATEIVNEDLTPLPWWQSEIAIDDRVSVVFSVNGVPLQPGDVLEFGTVPVGSSSSTFTVVSVPESGTAGLLIAGLALLGMLSKVRIRKQFLTCLVALCLSFAASAQEQQSKPQPLCIYTSCGGNGGGYQGNYTPPLAGGPGSPGSFSVSVANGVASSSVTAQNHVNTTSRYTAADYTAMATSMGTFFSEMDATGSTATLQSWILTHSSLFLSNPTSQEVMAAYTALNRAGYAVAVSESTFVNAVVSVPLTTRRDFYDKVRQYGLKYIHAQIVSNLHALASMTANQGTSNFYRVALPMCQVPWIGIGAAYFGIASLAISGPVGWGIGAVATFVGTGSLFELFGGC